MVTTNFFYRLFIEKYCSIFLFYLLTPFKFFLGVRESEVIILYMYCEYAYFLISTYFNQFNLESRGDILHSVGLRTNSACCLLLTFRVAWIHEVGWSINYKHYSQSLITGPIPFKYLALQKGWPSIQYGLDLVITPPPFQFTLYTGHPVGYWSTPYIHSLPCTPIDRDVDFSWLFLGLELSLISYVRSI